MCARTCICFWNCGENIHQKRWGFLKEVGFIGKDGRDFVVKELSASSQSKHLKDTVAVGVCVYVCDSTSAVAAKTVLLELELKKAAAA